MNEETIRLSLFDWLNDQSLLNNHVFLRKQLENDFKIEGKAIKLVGPSGIWKPAGFKLPVSITTTPGNPYEDGPSEDGELIYKYRGENPNHRDNVWMRELMKQSIPLVYFQGIKPGKYIAIWPVFIKEDIPAELSVRVELNPVYMMCGKEKTNQLEEKVNPGIRKYIWVSIRQRVHQATFREFVLDAYGRRCTLCDLQHDELLEAAHIIPDPEEKGEPVVPNGLSLCKIHHAAFDKNIIGVSPDYYVKVRRDILDEEDGPMLKYGLQAMEGHGIRLPRHRIDYPDKDRLYVRFKRFLSA